MKCVKIKKCKRFPKHIRGKAVEEIGGRVSQKFGTKTYACPYPDNDTNKTKI